MKYGFCVNMIADDPWKVGYRRIAGIREAGFDYVELPIAQIMVMSEAEFENEILRALETFPCLCCNNFFPAVRKLTGPAVNEEENLLYARAAFGRMRKMGAEKVVFGSSGARNYPCGWERSQAEEQLVRFLTELGAMAKEARMDIVIEPLNRGESNLIHTVKEACAVAQQVGCERVNVLGDTYHMNMEQEPFTDLTATGGRLMHIHTARLLGRTLPAADDACTEIRLFRNLYAAGYQKTVSVEAYAEGAVTIPALSDVLAYLKETEENICLSVPSSADPS